MFTLLMTISTLAYTYIQQKTQGSNVPAQMRIISYLMPVVFLGILNNYSSGLSYYYLVFNVLTIGHMQLIKQFIDKDKLHEQIIEAKHKKSKKPKGWMQRWMEDKQKQQREMQRDRSRQRK